VLVVHDALGYIDGFHPRHARKYLSLAGEIRAALKEYADDVREGRFPAAEHTVSAAAELAEYLRTRS
jgi:3-methyl-2-oxobutanoate hydroxymethyltransferase